MQTAVRDCACTQIAAQPASLCPDLGFDLWQRYLSEHIDHGYIDYDYPGDNQGHNYKLHGHYYCRVFPNDISCDDDNGEPTGTNGEA